MIEQLENSNTKQNTVWHCLHILWYQKVHLWYGNNTFFHFVTHKFANVFSMCFVELNVEFSWKLPIEFLLTATHACNKFSKKKTRSHHLEVGRSLIIPLNMWASDILKITESLTKIESRNLTDLQQELSLLKRHPSTKICVFGKKLFSQTDRKLSFLWKWIEHSQMQWHTSQSFFQLICQFSLTAFCSLHKLQLKLNLNACDNQC